MFNSLIKSTRAFSTTAARARVPVVGKFQPSLYLILPITYYLFNIYSMLTSLFSQINDILKCTKPFHHPYHVLTCNFCHSCFFLFLVLRFSIINTMCFLSTQRSIPILNQLTGGNWKCNAGNGTTMSSVQELVTNLNAVTPSGEVEIFCAAPAIYLDYITKNLNTSYNSCSQNVWKEVKGAYTGEISADMLVDMGVNWTLVGHSERRDIFGEKDELLQAKITRAQEVGMTVVACCGEHKEDREAGKFLFEKMKRK